ncbi:MAG: hypothetical protein KatS3mg015_2340 [Fimbriimonadales bacterium]|nr:MAG: hypothetical protein KatS3mg015_2340 [Fimbriimonadales bacterium]
MGRRAFTLIELLVNMAIIAILMSLLFPVFVVAKNRVIGFTSMSNLRQIGMALNAYLDEAEGHFPKPYWAGEGDKMDDNKDGVVEWYEQLGLYVGDPRIFRSKSDPTDPRQYPCSYADNSWFDYFIHISSVPDPANTIYATERQYSYQKYFIEWWYWQTQWPPDPTQTPAERAKKDIAHDRYNGSNNYLFVDGRVAFLRFPQTWSPRVLWYPDSFYEREGGEP